jgi:tyrosyl-tRNA synthetase
VRRLLRQGAIDVDGNRLADTNAWVKPGSVIRVGKRRFLRIVDADKQP